MILFIIFNLRHATLLLLYLIVFALTILLFLLFLFLLFLFLPFFTFRHSSLCLIWFTVYVCNNIILLCWGIICALSNAQIKCDQVIKILWSVQLNASCDLYFISSLHFQLKGSMVDLFYFIFLQKLKKKILKKLLKRCSIYNQYIKKSKIIIIVFILHFLCRT